MSADVSIVFKPLIFTVLGVFLFSQSGWSKDLFPKEHPQIESLNFDFYLYDDLKGEDIEEIIFALEDARSRLLLKYGLDSTPRVKVRIWGKWDTWAKENQGFLALNPGYVGKFDGFNQFSMLKIDSSEKTSSLTEAEHDFRDMMREPSALAVHEYMHVLTSYLNTYYRDIPRWLFESIACYESVSDFDLSRFSDDIDYFRQPFSEMNKGDNAYILGYSIIKYILGNWGHNSLVKLVQNNGDTNAVLNISQENFENGFWKFLHERYFASDANKTLDDVAQKDARM